MTTMLGCTNPKAVNYNPLSDQDDGSCIYLHKVGGVCYAFGDVDQNSSGDQSFTVSYSVEGNAWVFYHDYIPDFYFSTRQQLYSLKNNSVWLHNKGPHGLFYKPTKNSFFIDVIFQHSSSVILNSIQFVTKVLNVASQVVEQKTLTHITVWNEFQCTGRKKISEYLPMEPSGYANSLSEYSFNELQNIVKANGPLILKSIFEDLRPDETSLDESQPWYEKGYMENNYFIVRLEFDNTEDKMVSLHSADVTIDQTIK